MTEAASRRVEAIYKTPEVAAQRRHVFVEPERPPPRGLRESLGLTFRGLPDVRGRPQADACPMNGIAVNQELSFRYERCDIPPGLTLAEWRRSRARRKRRMRLVLQPHLPHRTR